jgi:hypothetical protein
LFKFDRPFRKRVRNVYVDSKSCRPLRTLIVVNQGHQVGTIYDYFRAADATAALQAMDRPGGPLFPQPSFDGVPAKRIDPWVVLGMLLAFVRGETWRVDTVEIWPLAETEPATRTDWDNLPDDRPWLLEFGAQVRDDLASVDDARLPDLAARWAKIKEFDGRMPVEDALSLIRDLAGLARRARACGDQLYCFTSV